MEQVGMILDIFYKGGREHGGLAIEPYSKNMEIMTTERTFSALPNPFQKSFGPVKMLCILRNMIWEDVYIFFSVTLASISLENYLHLFSSFCCIF